MSGDSFGSAMMDRARDAEARESTWRVVAFCALGLLAVCVVALVGAAR